MTLKRTNCCGHNAAEFIEQQAIIATLFLHFFAIATLKLDVYKFAISLYSISLLLKGCSLEHIYMVIILMD